MATTTNYGWDTPDDTDLVKDGAAAIRTLGSSVDTTTKALNPSTTLGDIEYRSATANTNTRLPIGTSGQVLAVSGGGVPEWTTTSDVTPLTTKGDLFTFTTVDARLGVGANGTVLTADSAEATGMKWAAGGATKTWTLLNTGGTALTGSSTVTVSGISDKEDILVLIVSAGFSGASQTVDFIINGDSGANYSVQQNSIEGKSAYAASFLNGYNSFGGTFIPLASTSSNAASRANGSIVLSGCKSTGIKNVDYSAGATHGGGSGHVMNFGQGIYSGSAAVTNISVIGSSAFTAGTIYVYGA
jgi:hypothetical protein